MLARIRRRLGVQGKAETARWASDGHEASGKNMPAFFVVGEPKSGTDWLTKILDSHPEVLCKAKGMFWCFGLSILTPTATGTSASTGW